MTLKNRKTKNFYPTWQEASAAAISLGFQKKSDYMEMYSKDCKLYSYPGAYYKDFPGWLIFLGNVGKHRGGTIGDFYPTWQEAVIASIALGIENGEEYRKKYYLDPRLYSCIYSRYPDFPGFPLSKISKEDLDSPLVDMKKAS